MRARLNSSDAARFRTLPTSLMMARLCASWVSNLERRSSFSVYGMGFVLRRDRCRLVGLEASLGERQVLVERAALGIDVQELVEEEEYHHDWRQTKSRGRRTGETA